MISKFAPNGDRPLGDGILEEGNLWSSQIMTLMTILKTKLMTRSSCHDRQHLPSSMIRKTPNLSKNARFRD